MKPTEPLALHHSWAACDAEAHFAHGLFGTMIGAVGFAERWSCDLATGALTWSDGVFDLFGFGRDHAIPRGDAVRRYAEGSRAVMERLRAHAIRHRRGFTVDVEIRPDGATTRWVRLTAAPGLRDGRTVSLSGTKQDVSALYS